MMNFASCRRDHNDSHHDKGDLLGPDRHVHVDAEPVHQDVKGLGDGIHLAHAVKHNVDGGDEDLPDAVDGEEVAEEVEVSSLPRGGPFVPLAHVLQIVRLKTKTKNSWFFRSINVSKIRIHGWIKKITEK